MTLFQLRSSAVLRAMKRVRGEGIGGLLLADAVRGIIRATRSLAVSAIVVDPMDEKAAVFYFDFGFVPFPNRPLRLFMPASEVAEAVSRALSRQLSLSAKQSNLLLNRCP
jgi:hypothetical protein